MPTQRQTRISDAFPTRANRQSAPASKAPQPAVQERAKPAALGKAAGTAAATRGKKNKRDSGPQFLDSHEHEDGETYRVGDDVYIIETEVTSQLPHDEDADLCCVCGSGPDQAPPRGGRGASSSGVGAGVMLECSRCLGGFHMQCLKPRLKKVPEGDWLCSGCERGEALPNRPLRTAADKFLWGQNILALGHVTAIVRNRCGDDAVEVAVKYYCRPENTHMGRQRNHGTREVFLTTTEHWEPVEVILWKAVVCRPQDMDEHSTNDLFTCEYVYDETFKRFLRRTYRERDGASGAGAVLLEGSDGDDSDWAASSDSGSDDEGDRNYKPIYEFKGFGFKNGMPKKYLGPAAGRRTAANRLGAAGPGAAAGGAAAAKGGKARRPAYEGEDVEALADTLIKGQGATTLPNRGPGTLFAQARRVLSLSTPPSTLPCRDAEKARVRSFVESLVSSPDAASSGVMYICGIPGTGKTACVFEVLSGLRSRCASAGVQVVTLNALSLPSPQHVYSKLWERLSGQRCGPARALAQLEAAFVKGGAQGQQQQQHAGAGSNRPGLTLLVVDEIDVLMTKDQSVLYNLFEWPTTAGARLAVVGISNTHDLDSRVLPRIASRLASSKLAFQAYSMEQLREIAKARLQGNELFKAMAVELAARKVASTSGDVRRVLELLRRAADAAEEEIARERAQGKPTPTSLKDYVSASHVQRAITEVYSSLHVQFLRGCSLLEKALMVALMLEMRATKKAVASVQALHQRLESHLSMLLPEAKCSEGTVVTLAAGLAAKGLLTSTHPWHHVRTKVQFRVEVADVATAFKDDARLAPLHGQMSAA